MSTQERKRLGNDLEELINVFLRDHPEAQEALDLFGISNEHYQRSLMAQQMPVFYTASSTVEGGDDGKLD